MILRTRLFSQTVTLQSYTGEDAYGAPTYGTIYTVKCREETNLEYLREHFGELGITNTVMYVISKTYEPKYNDKVTTLSGAVFPVQYVLTNRDENGTAQFYTIVLGARS